MKKYVEVAILIIIGLALLLPLASTFPDGLETVAEALGIEQQELMWKGLMPDYTIPSIENSYLSGLFSGVLGMILVFFAAFFIGKAIKLGHSEK